MTSVLCDARPRVAACRHVRGVRRRAAPRAVLGRGRLASSVWTRSAVKLAFSCDESIGIAGGVLC